MSETTLTLQINGKEQRVDTTEPLDVYALLAHLHGEVAERGIAVAVNDQVVPRGQWKTHTLSSNDRIEIISATQGG